jgi:selenocysteine-specific elongation factor
LEKDGIIDVADAMRQQPALAAHLVDHLFDRTALGEVVNLGQDIIATTPHWQTLLERMRTGLGAGFTASQARDVLGLSRRFVIPLLEYCDQHQITRRHGDGRTLV